MISSRSGPKKSSRETWFSSFIGRTFAPSTRSARTVDIGVWLLDLAVFACKGSRGRDALDTHAPISPHDGPFVFVHHRPFYGMQRPHESVHVTHLDSTISARWQRAAGQDVNLGILAADEQNSFSRLDAGVNFRRNYIADEGVAQRDQVYVRSEEKSRKLLEWNQARSINRHATR